MRTVVVATGFCLVNLVMAQAYGQAAAESIAPVKPMVYGLVAAVGEEFSVVSAKPSIGSHLSPYRRSTIEVPDNILNRFALHGLDKAIADIDPKSTRIYMTLPAAQMAGVAPSQRESVAIGRIVSELEKMPQRLEWDRIVIVTPENRVIAANSFLAPFSYIEVWILDPKTLAVLDKQERFANQKLADSRARILDMSQNDNREFLASRVNSLIELSVGEAVMHSEINHRGRVEVGEPKVVNPDDANK